MPLTVLVECYMPPKYSAASIRILLTLYYCTVQLKLKAGDSSLSLSLSLSLHFIYLVVVVVVAAVRPNIHTLVYITLLANNEYRHQGISIFLSLLTSRLICCFSFFFCCSPDNKIDYETMCERVCFYEWTYV